MSEEEEHFHRTELHHMKRDQNIVDETFYHYDTPLTVEYEKEAFTNAGFSSVSVLNS